MELSFISNKEQTWLPGEDGSKLALIDHPEVKPGVVNIVHTEVDPSLGGQGIAGKMTQAVAEQLRSEGRKAILTCSYAVKWFAEHPEYSDVLEGAEEETKKKIVQTAGRDALGEFAPEFAHFNDDILFGENWNNEELDLKTRCLITVVALMAQGITDSSLKYHIMNAKKNGVTQKEMAAAITHVAFYAGWPKAWAVFNLAKEVYSED